MEYKPKLKATKRDGKIALWVTMPGGYEQNVWDLDAETLANAEDAILSALRIGAEMSEQVIRQTNVYIPTLAKFPKPKETP